jgi:hypothetical protein
MEKINQRLREKYSPLALKKRLGLRMDSWYEFVPNAKS